jgi:hypothetical protein
LGVRLRRDALGRHAQGVQESPDGLSGGNGGFGRVEAAQVHMQLLAADPNYVNRTPRLIDASWGLERMIGALAGITDLGPFPSVTASI